ncbi:MAG: GDP-mannose 4,6-dehydratase, partial [bacterium]
KELGIAVEFSGEGVNEVGRVKSCSHREYQLNPGTEIIKVDPKYYRPTEVDLLIGDPTKAKTQLGWKLKYDLAALVKDMVNSDMELFKRDQYLLSGGHKVFNYYE